MRTGKSFHWTANDFEYDIQIDEGNLVTPQNIQYENKLFSDDVIDLMDIYSTQKAAKCVNINPEKIQDFLDIELIMSIV